MVSPIWTIAFASLTLVGPDGTTGTAPPERTPGEAASAGLALVRQAAAQYPEHRSCFSCHHQTLTMLAMAAARDLGEDLDDDIREQAEFSLESFRERLEPMTQGKGIGGGAMTVGYGLWAIELAGLERDEVSDAMAAYLLRTQKDDGRWRSNTGRPPLEGSDAMCTTLAARGLRRYTPPDQTEAAEGAIDRARAWLIEASPVTQEDRVARLWGLHQLGADPDPIEDARGSVLASQRADGGWAQEDGMESDAYATGQALQILLETGTDPSDPAIGRGIRFLIRTQLDDGSWRVATRGKPIQVFFDNGDPHGVDQFISTSATCWAVAALAAFDEAATHSRAPGGYADGPVSP